MELFKKILSPFILLTEDELAILSDYLEETSIPKHHYFLRSGEICRHLALVKSGLLQVVQHVEGKDVSSNFFSVGDIFTSSPSFQLGIPSEGSYMALTDVQLALIRKDKLEQLYERGQKWERLGRLIAEKQLIEMIQLKNALNYKSPRERLDELTARIPEIFQHATQHQISSYLGISRSHYNRILDSRY
jgi:CRP-like cAMP-binding protein